MEQLNSWYHYRLSIPALAVSIINNTINGQCLTLSPKYWIHELLTTNEMYSSMMMIIDHQRK